MEMPMGNADQYVAEVYAESWRRIQRHVLEWSESEIAEWLTQNRGLLRSPYLNHDDAGWYVAPLMMPEHLRSVRTRESIDLRMRIEKALHAARADNPDWTAIKANINQLLRQVGEMPLGAGPTDEHVDGR